MKYFILGFIFLVGCTDTQRASIDAYGRPGTIECYSGGKVIFEGSSTGRIATVDRSDGWEFKDEITGKFIRISGTCVIRN